MVYWREWFYSHGNRKGSVCHVSLVEGTEAKALPPSIVRANCMNESSAIREGEKIKYFYWL